MTTFVDDVIRAGVNVSKLSHLDYFYAGDPSLRVFQCSVPESQFQNEFHWFYLYSNGKYEQIRPESKVGFILCNNSNFILTTFYTKIYFYTENNMSRISPYYTEKVWINFPSSNITHVVCVGYLKDDGSISYNNSVAVKVKGIIKIII